MTAPKRIRTSDRSEARQAVLRQLAAAHDMWAVYEQIAVQQGDPVEAEGSRRYADWVLRAYRAELDNPEVPHG